MKIKLKHKHYPQKVATGLLFFLSVANFVFSESTTFVVEGELNSVDSALTNEFSVGELFYIEFTFESTAVDSNVSPSRGFYESAISSLSIDVGGYTASSTDSDITIFDDVGSTLEDQYLIQLSTFTSGPDVNGLSLSASTLMQLRDPTGSAFSDDSLPLTPLNLESFPTGGGNFLQLQFEDSSGSLYPIFSSINSFSIVPEPSYSTLLLALGSIILVVVSKKKYRS